MMKKTCSLFAGLCMAAALHASTDIRPNPLKFDNGRFKIVQFTDLHWHEADFCKKQNDSTCALIEEIVRIEKPDLAVLTGDIIVSWNSSEGWKNFMEFFEKLNLPYVVSFGNHDQETEMNNAQILDYLQTLPHNLTHDAEEGLSGSGNCSIPVLSSDGKSEKWRLYFFDSHSSIKTRTFGWYDFIRQDQVDWYKRTSDQARLSDGRRLPSLAFFHIPFPEFEVGKWICPAYGNNEEAVSAPTMNTGLYSAFIDKRDVIGVFVGHDHNNDYMLDMDGNIVLAFGRKSGYPPAYKEVLERGARIIRMHENEPVFDTYIRDLEGIHFPYQFEQKNHGTNVPSFGGTFIQEPFVKNWSSKRWDREMSVLKEAGMKYLIYMQPMSAEEHEKRHAADAPSSPAKRENTTEPLAECLRSARRHGMKVFLSLNFNDRWWRQDYDEDWLLAQMETGNRMADELLKKYKGEYPETMYGWYWMWEVDNLDWNTAEKQQMLVNALNVNLHHLSKVSPDMPLMLSPFMNKAVGAGAEQYGQMWANIISKADFRPCDIFAPQDCIGSGGLEIDDLWTWFPALRKAVYAKPGMKFWGNIELFTADGKPADMQRIIRQLLIVNGYTSNMVCFSYPHHFSPYAGDRKHHQAYLAYLKETEDTLR